jgi:NAD+ diphosphatase
MTFIPDFKQATMQPEQGLWFVYQAEKLIVKVNGDSILIPGGPDLQQVKLAPIRQQYLGALDGRPCLAAELPAEVGIPDGYKAMGLRELFGSLEDEYIWIAGRANQLVDWTQSHQFCGRCATPTEDKADERAKVCPQCGLINYPRLSPAVIVAVYKENQLLLARNRRFRSGYYSVLAGFVEPGETLEDCVKREIYEEVNVDVKNIRYFGSQPWPFPNSLMVAFTAEYAGGRIKANQAEITEAGWFTADELPHIPPKITIARWLIDWFKSRDVFQKAQADH